MMTGTKSIAVLLSVVALAWVTGCGPAEKEKDKDKDAGGADPHAHPTEGPHHGDLIELGDEEYHAELVHDDDAGTVTVYILDSAAKKAVAIDAQEIKIALKHDGTPEEFVLKAEPDTGDTEGKSSRFVSQDAELAEDLEHEDAGARLLLDIAGKSYNGKIEHAHDEHHAH